MSQEVKYCRKCNVMLDQNNKAGHQNLCKPCDSARIKVYQQMNKERNQNNWCRPALGKCSLCQEFLPGTYFPMDVTTTSGLSRYCKYHTTIYGLKARNAKNKQCRELTMELSRDQYFKLLSAPCYYCGSIENIGVDRVNNAETYKEENCVSCCWSCNDMKGTLDGYKFLNMIQKIANHRLKILNDMDQQNEEFEEAEDSEL